MGAPRPYTADMLAERWMCSAETVRQMVKRGELRGFRVGRMIRIPLDAVEEYECKSVSEDSEADTAPTGGSTESEPVVSLMHAPERKRRRKR